MIKIRQLALAALAAASFNAQAALVTYEPWNTTYPSISGVLFNVNSSNGVTVAMGAHAYKNGVNLANDGASTFFANSGIYAPDGKGRANWSFDFAWDLGTNCSGCTVELLADKDPTAAVNLERLFKIAPFSTAPQYFESWNMEMTNIGVSNFDPYSASSTAFSLRVRDANDDLVTSSDITVNVPEPGSIALLSLGLIGIGAVTRRRKNG